MRTRSKTKRTRENLNRLPREVEATLPSWVKCTDPIPREILEEVRSTVLVWMKNVKNYVEETETYILNDEHTPPEIVDEGFAFDIMSPLCLDPYIEFKARWHTGPPHAEDIDAERFWDTGRLGGERFAHTGWSKFIRRIIRSDVNTFKTTLSRGYRRFKFTEIVVGSDKENYDEKYNRIMLRLAVEFHERLSSETKDEICSKLASALRALKSRISRICGINELERRTRIQRKH